MTEYVPATERRLPRVAARGRLAVSTSQPCTVEKFEKGRRGRPGRDEYVRLVMSLVRDDVWALDKCSAFATYPGVRTLVAQHQRTCLPMGTALKLIIERAVCDVLVMTTSVPNGNLARVGLFLQLWYCEGDTVVGVARALGLERTHVVKTVQRPALDMVARRFLALAEQVDPLN